jgi:hypothetical protein
LIGRLNQPAADGFLPLREFKPSSSDSTDRGRSIIQVIDRWVDLVRKGNKYMNNIFEYIVHV